jgi:toxin ParE1/3/4
MRLKLSLRAIADIDRIYLESARSFGISQADTYQAGLRASFTVIAKHPLLARERTEFRRRVRVHPYESHVIVYLADERGVLVIRVLHAHQNLRRIL